MVRAPAIRFTLLTAFAAAAATRIVLVVVPGAGDAEATRPRAVVAPAPAAVLPAAGDPRLGPAGPADRPADGAASAASSDPAPLVRRPLRRGSLLLVRRGDGTGELRLEDPDGTSQPIPCEPLEGAWGLWVGDIDGDGRGEALVALRKPARFDPVLENRLHVHSFENGRCVPAWRGTRLAGRFDDLYVPPDDRAALRALERVAGRRRVAAYRWNDFGYRLESVLWEGDGSVPAEWQTRFETQGGAP
jgi:hypothetical protein